MNRKASRCFAILAALLALAAPFSLLADDSAASIAVGGLIPRRETRIVMAKEVLRIGLDRIVVDYDFRNDSDEDVTTEVAFPIPRYENSPNSPRIELSSFSTFKLWVNGKPIEYKTEARAFVGEMDEKDVTAVLEANRIDIPSFGHFRQVWDQRALGYDVEIPDLARLSTSQREKLTEDGVLADATDSYGQWRVHLQYHWTQSFPAHSTTHIRHEYVPAPGFEDTPVEALDLVAHTIAGDSKRLNNWDVKVLTSLCVEPSLALSLRRLNDLNTEEFRRDSILPQLVDFILTSANTWKTPIEDFTLVVARPKPDKGLRWLISFCSPQNAKVEKIDADDFQVHLTNFVPTTELHIGFFFVPDIKPAPPSQKR